MNRTHNNGQLRLTDINKEVVLKGWVAKRRDLGGLIFIDLRDKEGITQLVVNPDNKNYELASNLKNEYVIEVVGKVIERVSKNNNMPTGDIEVEVIELTVLNTSMQPPIIVADKTDALEETRLKYRYLDLRRPIMQKNLIMKSKITNSIRNYLSNEAFYELETPILGASTPEGARDFLVPSRIYNGKFYALPQSPQIFKQLYMIAGFERYFQIAKCFRDEDLRADRQLEFNQIDIETSFLNQEEILSIVEGLFKHVFKDILNKELPETFKRLSYEESINTYGTDKPDLRYGMKLTDVKDLLKSVEFMQTHESVKAIVANNVNYTRKQLDEFTRIMKDNGASGLAYLKYTNNELTGSFIKFLNDEDKLNIINELKLQDNDMVFVICDKLSMVNKCLGALRRLIAKEENLYSSSDFQFVWITDWPMFEYNEDTKTYDFTTHPFTAPKPECVKYLDNNQDKCYANAYDLVLNGYELGSGSLRVYNQELQEKIFNAIGLTKEVAEERFGFFVEALKYGTPPHGGIGLGLERIVMCMLETENIKDVVAFPKTLNAKDLMMNAPSTVEDTQLEELGIILNSKE